MALKAGYYGLKRSLLNKVKALPGIKSIGTGLSLNSTTGELEATGATISIEANPEASATENLIKLGLGENVYAVPDAAKTYQTDDATESAIVDADYIPFFDSSAASGSGVPKKSTWSNFISKIKAKITEYVTWEANNILGAKNLCFNGFTTGTSGSTINWTANTDGTVRANGNTSVRANKNIDIILPKGNYIASGCPDGGGSSTWQINFQDRTPATPVNYFDSGDGVIISLSEEINTIRVYLNIEQLNTDVDITFKPMIRLATDPDDTYVPYAMTNRELTPVDKSSDIEEIIGTLNTANNYATKTGKLLSFCVRVDGVTCNAYDPIAKIKNVNYKYNDTFIIGKIGGGDIIGFQIGNIGTDIQIRPMVSLNNQNVTVFNATVPTK